jgi:hypothetical protein
MPGKGARVGSGVSAMAGDPLDPLKAEAGELDWLGFRECASKTHPPRKLKVLASMITPRKVALKNLICILVLISHH